MRCESYIKDSQDLIIKTKNVFIPSSFNIFSCDFESLYTNIPHSTCLSMICDFLSDKFDNNHLNISAFKDLLLFILDNNYFLFDDIFYKQTKCIAMGSACGPSIANLFVFLYEKKWLYIHKPLIYYRFIDDIFIVSRYDYEQMSSSFSYHRRQRPL